MRATSVHRAERLRQEYLELRKGLSPEEQTLLFLRVDQELSWAEVAEALSEGGKAVDPDTACKRFERLKGRLRGLARGRGILG